MKFTTRWRALGLVIGGQDSTAWGRANSRVETRKQGGGLVCHSHHHNRAEGPERPDAARAPQNRSSRTVADEKQGTRRALPPPSTPNQTAPRLAPAAAKLNSPFLDRRRGRKHSTHTYTRTHPITQLSLPHQRMDVICSTISSSSWLVGRAASCVTLGREIVKISYKGSLG